MRLSNFFHVLVIGSTLSLQAIPPPPPNGSWGNFVYIYTTATAPATINADTSAAFTKNGAALTSSSSSGFAFLFAPGTYSDSININVGTYTSIIGMGASPADTILNNVTAPLNNGNHCTGAFRNIWKSAENFQTTPTLAAPNQIGLTGMTWACSNGSPLRRMRVKGNLFLSEKTAESGNPYGASTGAFVADSTIDNTIYGGMQQQSLMRNSFMSAWTGGKWNQVFVGCSGGVPDYSCGNCVAANIQADKSIQGCTCTNSDVCAPGVMDPPSCNTTAISNVTPTPRIAEKPFISSNGAGTTFTLNIPKNLSPREGPSNYSDTSSYTSIPFSEVFVADSPEAILENINNPAYKAMIITPGTHVLSKPIFIDRSDFTLLGIGFPVLVNTSFIPGLIEVGNGSGIRIAGLILDGTMSDFAGETPTLLEWGDENSSDPNRGTECYLYDCFARIEENAVTPITDAMIKINSPHVVCDNIWLVRSDFFLEPFGGAPSCPTGARINGEDVIVYGMVCDNFSKDLLEWYGDKGQCYSFQGTFPFDAEYDYDMTGYLVNLNSVQTHTAYGLSLYCAFQNQIFVQEAISTPDGQGILFVNALTRYLRGQGGIDKVINVSPGNNTYISPWVSQLFPGPSSVCEYSGQILAKPVPFSNSVR